LIEKDRALATLAKRLENGYSMAAPFNHASVVHGQSIYMLAIAPIWIEGGSMLNHKPFEGHTPGPYASRQLVWKLIDTNMLGITVASLPVGSVGEAIAVIDPYEDITEEQRANARLLAAKQALK